MIFNIEHRKQPSRIERHFFNKVLVSIRSPLFKHSLYKTIKQHWVHLWKPNVELQPIQKKSLKSATDFQHRTSKTTRSNRASFLQQSSCFKKTYWRRSWRAAAPQEVEEGGFHLRGHCDNDRKSPVTLFSFPLFIIIILYIFFFFTFLSLIFSSYFIFYFTVTISITCPPPPTPAGAILYRWPPNF